LPKPKPKPKPKPPKGSFEEFKQEYARTRKQLKQLELDLKQVKEQLFCLAHDPFTGVPFRGCHFPFSPGVPFKGGVGVPFTGVTKKAGKKKKRA
jgi:hypothetical protein